MTFRIILLGFAALFMAACELPLEPVNGTGFDQASAEALGEAILDGDEYLVDAFVNPTKYAGSSNLEAEMASLLQRAAGSGLALSGLETQQGELGCTSEDTTSVDADGDGIPVNSSYVFECRALNEEGAGVILKGEKIVQDKDDTEAVSGYLVDLKNLEIQGLDGQGNVSFGRVRLKVDLTWNNPNYRADYDFEIEGQWAGQPRGSIAHAYTASYLPDVSSDPFTGGTLDYAGALSFTEGSNTYTLEAETIDLHYTETCLGSFDRGTRTFAESNGNSLKIVYTSCRNATVSFTSGNGSVLTSVTY